MKKTIREIDVNNKRVIIRVDFNVPIVDGVITDDNRIKESIPTIEYAVKEGAKVILMSHLGRVKEEEDKSKNSLAPVRDRLSELMNCEVKFSFSTNGPELEDAVTSLNSGEILLIENTRFEDVPEKRESGNDPELGTYWASLGDVFINDAFGTAHRAHASNVGIASNIPENGVGFLIEKELNIIAPAISNPERKLTVILAGAKVKDKIEVIRNLVKVADTILIGGGMAYTFHKANGLEIGNSLLDENNIEFCKEMMESHGDKIVLSVDCLVTNTMDEVPDKIYKIVDVENIEPDLMGVDIGPKTVELFKGYLLDSKTVIMNGPLGVFENERSSEGTKSILEIMKDIDGTVIIGGGDTASAVINFGYKDAFAHISTGGGASLEMLEGKVLPGIAIISEK